MKRVSLKAKVPGLCVLGALGVTFLLSPLGAFAGCGGGGGQAAAQPVMTVKSTLNLFGQACGGSLISTAEAGKLATESWGSPTTPATTQTTNSTVANDTTTPPKAPSQAEIASVQLLASVARCTFNTIPSGKTSLANGDIVLGTSQLKNADPVPVISMVVNNKLVVLSNRAGQLNLNPKLKLGNAVIDNSGNNNNGN